MASMLLSSLHTGAALVLLLVLLSLNVSRIRMTRRISLGDGEHKSLRNAVRAHGNAVEHILPFIILLWMYETAGGPAASVHALGLTFLVARLLHATGMLAWQLPYRIRLRQAGAAATLLCLSALAVLCLLPKA